MNLLQQKHEDKKCHRRDGSLDQSRKFESHLKQTKMDAPYNGVDKKDCSQTELMCEVFLLYYSDQVLFFHFETVEFSWFTISENMANALQVGINIDYAS